MHYKVLYIEISWEQRKKASLKVLTGGLWKQRERKTERSESRILLSLHKMNTSPTLSIYTLQDW